MASNNNGSQGLGEDNPNLSQDPPQAITITIMEPSSTLGETLDKKSISTTNLNSNISSIVSSGSNAGTFLVVPSRGTVTDVTTSTVISGKEHVLQTSISKTELEEEFPVISNISNPEEVLDEGQEVMQGEVYDGEDVDFTASSGPHCLICNKELQQTTQHSTSVPIFQVQTTATQRKMSVLLGGLVGQKITSRKSHSALVCGRCYNLLDKVDSLEVELQDTKTDIINKYQTTLGVYGGRARRRKPATSKKTDFVFPKLEPDEPEREEVNLEFDSNFEPRDEDLLEEEADQQEDLIASGALDDEWEPEFKRSRLKRENTDTDPGVAPKRRRGRPRKDVTKPKELMQESQGCHKVVHAEKPNIRISSDVCPVCNKNFASEIETKEHFDSSHIQPDGYICPICYKVIGANFHEILCHLRKYCKIEPFENISDQKIQEKQDKVLQKRIKGINKKKKGTEKVTCQECGKIIQQKQLKIHMNIHTKEVAYPCPECSAVYYDPGNLLSHRKRHHFSSEARKHDCQICGKKCPCPSELKRHIMAKHQNYLPMKKFVCELCGKTYANSSGLLYHQRTHTGERPLICDICGRNFAKPSSISKHMRNVHHVEYQGKYRKRFQQSESQVKSLASSQDSSISKEETALALQALSYYQDANISEETSSTVHDNDSSNITDLYI